MRSVYTFSRGDGVAATASSGSETAASRACSMPKFANLRTRRITQVARFGASVNVYGVLMMIRLVPLRHWRNHRVASASRRDATPAHHVVFPEKSINRARRQTPTTTSRIFEPL
ncbi:hypothetical protein Y032_0643g1053 [Ancylostoma ceylanicum]|uniref:Uncharacterized protein n=1 Tax=Ancylostoma ceylanicum TaxID=53326 RepID=A0A016WL11_9BILA|nr:hypothetical protein Y032_0643g1053 [Ancylostoma ceylanicum]